jgi:hypothetical protein
MDWWGYVILGASSLSGILAWASKLYWAKEHKQAIDQTIAAKDAQIVVQNETIKSWDAHVKQLDDHIKRLTGEYERERELFGVGRTQDFIKAYRAQIEQYNDILQEEIAKKEQEFAIKDSQVAELRKAGDNYIRIIVELEQERNRLHQQVVELTTESESFKADLEQIETSRESMRMPPPFGGVADEWHTLSPSASPPEVGYRLIPGQIWWEYMYREWLEYRALRARGLKLKFPPPRLAPPTSQGFFFTDQESLEGIMLPEQFARRFGLSSQEQQECEQYGCTIIKFHLPKQGNIVVPDPYRDQPPGLSPGGAREWKTNFNLPLDSSMEVTYTGF